MAKTTKKSPIPNVSYKKQHALDGFDRLIILVRSNFVEIGVDRKFANNFWVKSTRRGKFLNTLTIVFGLTPIILFFTVGIISALVSLVWLMIYVVLLQEIAIYYVKMCVLRNVELFDLLFDTKKITLLRKLTGEIVKAPEDWGKELGLY